MEVRDVVRRNGDTIISRIFYGGMDSKSIIPREIRGLDRGLSDPISELYDAVGVFAVRNRVIRLRSTENTCVFGVVAVGERFGFSESAHTGIRT